MPVMIGSDGGAPFPVLTNNQSCVSHYLHLSDHGGSPPPHRHHYPCNHHPHHPQYLVQQRHFLSSTLFLGGLPGKGS